MRSAILIISLIYNLMAIDVNIAEDINFISVKEGDRIIKIKRVQGKNSGLPDEFKRISKECPPFCIQPMYITHAPKPIGEIELLNYLRI